MGSEKRVEHYFATKKQQQIVTEILFVVFYSRNCKNWNIWSVQSCKDCLISSVFHHFIKNGSKIFMKDFSGGPVVKNLPVTAGDIGPIPRLGGPHMPWSN